MSTTVINNTFLRLRDEIIDNLSFKEINTKDIYDSMLSSLKQEVPESVLDFFLKSDLNMIDFKKQLAALMDIVIKLKHFDNTRRFVISRVAEEQSRYQDLSAILSRYNIPFEIVNGFVRVIRNGDTLEANLREEGSLNKLLDVVVPDKVVLVSPTIRLEEKMQPLLIRDNDIANPLLSFDREFEDLKFDQLDNYEYKVEELDPFCFNDVGLKFNMKYLDMNKFIQIDFPKTRSSNPDYLYAIGHEWAHFYTRNNYLHDRFMYILEHLVEDAKSKVVISCYTDFIATKLHDSGYKVTRGYNSSLDPDREYWIHPDITDYGFENYGTIPGIPDYMVTLNKHMSEVAHFTNMTNSVCYPYYLTWLGNSFDKSNFKPLAFHRPFVMICGDKTNLPTQKIYWFTTLHLSAYRTYLLYTGESYDVEAIRSHPVLKNVTKWFDILNEMKIVGIGHKGYLMYRETMPEFDMIKEKREQLFGSESDYYKVIAPLLTPNVAISNYKGRRVVNKKGDNLIEIRTKMKPVILRYNKYLRHVRNSVWYGPLTKDDYSFSKMARIIE